jgi:hypothetical protein
MGTEAALKIVTARTPMMLINIGLPGHWTWCIRGAYINGILLPGESKQHSAIHGNRNQQAPVPSNEYFQAEMKFSALAAVTVKPGYGEKNSMPSATT